MKRKEKTGKEISLGEFITRRRRRLHLTQEQLAEKIFVSKSAVAKWETNGGIPDRDNLYKLGAALGVTVDDLHHIIEREHLDELDQEVNITAEVISTLESYGYKIIRPGEEKE